MIVSFERRFAFIAIPKTAGHALRAILRPLMGPQDWEQCGLFEVKRFPIKKLAKIGHGHITCRQLIPHLPEGAWDNLFSFAFVRNPYDRFISYSTFINRGTDRMLRDPLGTMKQSLQDPRQLLRIHMRPQYEFISDRRGNILIDYIAKYENIQKECDLILDRLGSEKRELPIINRSDRTRYQDYYDDELREMIANLFKRDLQLFDYDYE